MKTIENDKISNKDSVSFLTTVLNRIESRRNIFRRFGWIGIVIISFSSFIATLRFFFPRVLFEPPSKFKIGKPSEYAMGSVSMRYKSKYRIWIVRKEDGHIYCLHAKCTHLGCTPNWLGAQNKFKCPCHGSGFYSSGENFEGPAPRPLDRFKMILGDDGQLIVDKSIVYKGVAGVDSDEYYPQSLLKA